MLLNGTDHGKLPTTNSCFFPSVYCKESFYYVSTQLLKEPIQILDYLTAKKKVIKVNNEEIYG